MKAAITALGWGCLGALLLAASCEKPESFHLVATAPTPGMDVNAAGGAGGTDPAGSGGQLMTMNSHFGTGGLATAGTIGAGGSGGSGGSAGVAGGGGGATAGGATGPGGSTAGGGAIGSAGGPMSPGGGAGGATTGLGGAGGVCAACALSIQCRNDSPGDSSAMHAEIWISNASAQPVALGQLRVRYYYINEGGTIGLEVFDKSFENPDGSGYRGSQATFIGTDGKLTTPPMDYTDIAITSTEMLDNTASFYFKMSLHDGSHTKLDLTNDYSAAPPAIAACPKIVAFFGNGVGNAVVAGTPP